MNLVAVELPEKQGLKRKQYNEFFKFHLSCSGTSRKTRIETFATFPLLFTTVYHVAVELPEKQGLKLLPVGAIVTSCSVAVELPEKQGLKLSSIFGGWDAGLTSCSGTSRKTRIETRNGGL